MKIQPVKLKNDPIVEAIFELRFEPRKSALSDLLPGLMYGKLGDRFPTLERLPFSTVPREFLQQAPDLKYQARFRLIGNSFAILFGDYCLSLSSLKPYVGWEQFKPFIIEILGYLKDSTLVGAIERYSIKYVNLLPAAHGDFAEQYKYLNFSANLGKFPLTSSPTWVRAEIDDANYMNLLEFAANAQIKTLAGEQLDGLLLTIDTISKSTDNFWDTPEKYIESAHQTEKAIFFETLSDEAGQIFGAIWEK